MISLGGFVHSLISRHFLTLAVLGLITVFYLPDIKIRGSSQALGDLTQNQVLGAQDPASEMKLSGVRLEGSGEGEKIIYFQTDQPARSSVSYRIFGSGKITETENNNLTQNHRVQMRGLRSGFVYDLFLDLTAENGSRQSKYYSFLVK